MSAFDVAEKRFWQRLNGVAKDYTISVKTVLMSNQMHLGIHRNQLGDVIADFFRDLVSEYSSAEMTPGNNFVRIDYVIEKLPGSALRSNSRDRCLVKLPYGRPFWWFSIIINLDLCTEVK